MFAEYKNTLRKLRGSMIGWGIGLLLYDWLMSSFFSSIVEMSDQLVEMVAAYPEEFIAFFPSIGDFASPVGYIDTYFSSYMTIILGFFVVGACAKLIVGDEESGTLDLVLAHPVSRTNLFWGRFLGFVTALVVILLASWVGWLIPAKSAGFTLRALDFLIAIFPLFGVLMVFGALALFFSMLLPAARLAGGLSGALLVGNFLLVGMSNLNQDLIPVYEVTPFYFYQGAKMIEDPNWGWFFGLLGVALVIVAISWRIFMRRDIRVGGEAGWQIPLRSAK